MIYTPTKIAGAVIIDIQKIEDERGFFGKSFDIVEFGENNLPTQFVQGNVSRSVTIGTLRGMHFQKGKDAEDKLVRCTKGKLFDVALDLRPQSPTYKQWFGTELSEDNHRAFFIPKGCAHGFITLEENTEASYLVTSLYAPQSAGGVRYNDPQFKIQWPIEMTVISDKDRNWPDFVEGDVV